MGTLSARGITIGYEGSYPNGGTRLITITSASINSTTFKNSWTTGMTANISLSVAGTTIASVSNAGPTPENALTKANQFINTILNKIANGTAKVSISRTHSDTTANAILIVGGSGDDNTFPVAARTSYPVSYNANGGTGATSSQTKWYGEGLALRSNGFSRSGFTFKQWNTKSDGTGTAYAAGATYTGNAALTLYAIWNRTVTYNANGGSGAPSAQTAIATNAITLSSVQPTYTGFTFKRWNTNASDTGTAYAPGASYAAGRASATLYAIWNHTITYNANGGSGAPGSQTALKTSAITVSTTKPTRNGYTFHHWNTKADGTGTTYNPGSTFAANAAGVTLYAIWHHTLTYNANGGSNAPETQSAAVGTPITVSTAVPTKANHRFIKWNTSADGTGADIVAGQTLGADDTNRTIYAIWEFYIPPVTSKLICTRSNASGEYEDEGNCVVVTADWRTTAVDGATGLASFGVVAKDSDNVVVDSDTLYNITGTVDGDYIYGSSTIILDGPFDTTKKYTIEIRLNDGASETLIIDTITKAFFPFDVLKYGHGAAFGKPATVENLFDVAYDGNFDGDLTARSVTQTSDRRKKTHIGYLDTEAVTFIDGLKPALFDNNGLVLPGFYAQDVQEVDPYDSSMVQVARNGFLSLNYTAIIAPLVAYVQALEARIESLEKGDE